MTGSLRGPTAWVNHSPKGVAAGVTPGTRARTIFHSASAETSTTVGWRAAGAAAVVTGAARTARSGRALRFMGEAYHAKGAGVQFRANHPNPGSVARRAAQPL